MSYKAVFTRDFLNWSGPEGLEENGYLLLRELGRPYDKSSHKVGAALRQLGLRDDDGPTQRAFHNHLVAPRGIDKFNWAWHEKRTCALLEAEAYWHKLP